MTTKEKIAVMEAFERGEELELKRDKPGKEWQKCFVPVWNWLDFQYRIKPPTANPTPAKRTFGPKDFPPGSVLRGDHYEPGTWSTATCVTHYRVYLRQTDGFEIALTYREMDDGQWSNWSISTDLGKTWTQLKP